MDGKVYNLAKIIEEINDDDDGDGDGGIPSTMNPAPEVMWHKSFYLIMWRNTAGGLWETPEETKMDFYDMNKANLIHSFTVLNYSDSDLYLSGEWEDQQRELYFNTDKYYAGPYPQ